MLPPTSVVLGDPLSIVSTCNALSGAGPKTTNRPLSVQGDHRPMRNGTSASWLAEMTTLTEASIFGRSVVARLMLGWATAGAVMSTESLVTVTCPVLPPLEYIKLESKPRYVASLTGARQSSAGASVITSIRTARAGRAAAHIGAGIFTRSPPCRRTTPWRLQSPIGFAAATRWAFRCQADARAQERWDRVRPIAQTRIAERLGSRAKTAPRLRRWIAVRTTAPTELPDRSGVPWCFDM